MACQVVTRSDRLPAISSNAFSFSIPTHPLPLPGGELVRSNDLFDHSAFDEREPLIPAQMWIGQLTLVEAELVEDGRVEVAEVDGSLDGAQANGVGGAQHLAAFDSSARQPHAEAEIVVVAALAGFRLGRTAKFTAPQHQRAVEQSASLQILQEPRDGL